jgi:glyoxylase-like metal-dependent hydrolase (beta-lactamase superfamily II)
VEIKVFNLGGYLLKNYILQTPAGVIAIDTGYPGGAESFRRRFTRRWPLTALKYIFLTHHHDDHAGFLGDLLAQCDAQVVLHPLALPQLYAGRNAEPPGAGYSSRPASWFSLVKKDFGFPPVDPGGRAVLVEREDDQPFERLGLPIKVVFLPGHTADSIGLYLPETRQLYCGDAAMNAVISVARHTIWIEDPVRFGQSWDRMLALSPKRVYPSHGAPFPPSDLLKYRHTLDGKKLIPPRERGEKHDR